MKYLIIGSGGREHTIAWRLLHDGSAEEVYVAPGNGGIDPSYRVDIAIDDHEAIISFCREKEIDLVVVGPEAPLAAGLVDLLQDADIKAFGPSKKAAQLEGSKLFAKTIMEKYNVPTAGHYDFSGKKELLEFVEKQTDFPIVIKLDGLAAGKGVAIPETKKEAIDFINEYVQEDTNVFVEDFLTGEEVSVLGISDGTTIKAFISAQDHKRIFEGDKGPNTGGMGAYSPAPVATQERLERIQKEVLEATVEGMKQEGIPFVGILYAGMIIDGDKINVLEFNVRFGDPEAQVILPLLEGKLGDIFQGAVNGNLDEVNFSFKKDHAITVVMSSGGYPGNYEKGKEITGLQNVTDDIIVFHAGTKEENKKIYTNGGRVLNVTATGSSLVEARKKAYGAVEKISFEGAFFRKDIAHRALNR